MKHTRFVTTILTILSTTIFTLQAQDQATLQFTGQNQNGQHVTLSTVTVENVTQHWQEMLYYPDTVLTIGPVGIHDPQSEGKGVRLFQNVPNPFDGVTDFVLYLPEASAVTLEICNLNGSVTATYTGSLDQGDNCFRAWLSSPQTYLLSARTEGGTVRIKMVNAGSAGQNRIEYLGNGETSPMAKSDDNAKGSTNLPFTFGDWMLYKGYANLAGTEFESVSVERQQYGSELITLTFSLPLPTVTTEAATDISATEAKLNGIVEEYAGYPIVERGFLFADNASLDGAVEHMAGSGAGLFYCVIANLQIATRYYFRAYAKTEIGTTYGDVLFLDTQAELPTVLTLSVTDVKASQATVTGNVTATGGETSLVRGFCWSTAQNPTVNDSHTSDIGGDGSFTSHITGLTPDTTYYVRAYATNSVGTAYGDQRSFTTTSPFFCGFDTVTDYDGNVYHTVEIGQQCWITENLRTTHYTDGTEIPVGTTISENTAYRYYPNNSSSNVPTYGYLYNWAAVMYGAASSNANPSGVQGICPLGWHVPSKAEFEQLMLFVSSQSQYLCDNNNIAKALATSFGWLGWSNDDYFCFPAYYTWLNNTTGFAAPPAGYWSGSSSAFGRDCTFWSSTSNDIYGNLSAFPFEVGNGVSINISDPTAYAHTVRCLLDDSWLTGNNAILPTITTKTIRDLSTSSASCGGQIYGSGGADVTNRGICWDTLPNPTVNNNHTSDGTGTGGYTSNMTNLMPNTTYYVRAYATNSVGTAYGEQRSFTTWDSLICDSTLTDYDGNIYHTVAIGQQCWMRENLRSTHFPDGTVIPLLTNAFTLPYRCVPNNDSTLIPTHGYLYNAYATQFGLPSNSGPIVVQGICPDGWHVPSTADWEQLIHFLRSRSEYCCWGDTDYIAQSLASNSGWEQNALPCTIGFDINANNASGFSALPAGSYNKTEGAVGINATTTFWHSTFNGNYTFLSIVSLGSAQCISPTIDEPSSPSAYEYQSGYSVRCLRDDSSAIVIPSVTTDTLRDIFFSSATCGGFVIESGSSTVSARGVCWSTSHNPTVNDSHTTNGSGTGSFTSHIDSLYANTTYYVRAYATNSVGTAYGEERSFTTLPTFYCGIDSVTDYDGNVYTTVEIGDQCWMKENLRTTHYADGTEILVGDPNSTYPTFPTTPYRCSPGNNNANVPVYGLLYNGYAACGSALTNFFQGVCPDGWHLPSQNEYEQLTSYVGNQSQYVCGGSSIAKSLASPSGWIGTSSNTCSVKYCPDENNATGFTAVPAGANGNSLGDSCIIWSRSWDGSFLSLKIKSFVVVDQTVILESFKANNSFLSVRCLLNESWIDSADLVVPCVTTDTSSNILSTSAICGGFVSGSGGSSVTARGVCWSTSHNPTVNDSHTTNGSGTGSFTSHIDSLYANTTYYVRAYATNSVGTAYGEERSFTTLDSSTMVIPSVTTDTLSAISISSATCGGFVIESGSSPVSARGVCWSTSHNPTVNDSHTTNGSGTGSFTSHIDSLYANTTYYVRAFATNSVGTAYGEERSFTTLPPFYCGIDSVTDYDGNAYPTVEIGDQCWMKENLRTTHYADGTEILVGDPNSTYPIFHTTPYRCAPGNNNANVPVYGLLYNGFAACGSALTNFFQGVCPDGWHLPNQNEYEQLIDYVGGQSQYVCGGSSIAKSLASPSGWIGTSSNTCSVKYCPDENNATGFTAVPAGANGNGLGESCIIWSRSWDGSFLSLEIKSFVVVDQTVCLNSFQVNNRFLSVRCLLNESWIDSADLVVPCVTTDTSSNILSTSATCGGFVSGSDGSSVTARGVCWSTSHNPTVNDSHTSEGSGTGHFSSNISGLATGTTYYVRAYATNSVGTAYGEERSFTTETSSVAPTQ